MANALAGILATYAASRVTTVPSNLQYVTDDNVDTRSQWAAQDVSGGNTPPNTRDFVVTAPSPILVYAVTIYAASWGTSIGSLLDGGALGTSYFGNVHLLLDGATYVDYDGVAVGSRGIRWVLDTPIEVSEFRARHTINNDICFQWDCWELYVEAISLEITAVPSSGTAPVAVNFTANITGTNYAWDFGDGSTSTDDAPTHVYSMPGSYTVTLVLDGLSATTAVTVSARAIPVSDELWAEVWIDWDDDGFSATGGADDSPLTRLLAANNAVHNDNVTPYVRSVNGVRGGQFDLLGGQTPGKATIIVNNHDGRWNEKNAAGPYYGVIRPGLRVWIGMRDDATPPNYYGLFAGYLDEIAPVPGPGNRTAQLIATDPFGYWQKQPVEVPFAEGRSTKDFRKAILTSLGVPDYNVAIDDEPDYLAASGIRADNALEVLEQLNKSVATRHWIEPADAKDDFFFYVTLNRNRNLGLEFDDTLDEDDIIAMDGYRTTRDLITNHLRVNFEPIMFAQADEDLWKSDGDVTMRKGSTKLVIEFSTWCRNVYGSCTFEESGGTLTVTNYGKSAAIDLFTTGEANVAKGLKLRGRPANDTGVGQYYEAIDQSSQDLYGKKAGSSVGGEYIQSSSLAQAVGESVVQRAKNPRARPTVRFRNRYDKFLPNGLYSVVRQSLPELSLVSEQYEVIGLTFNISNGDKVRDFSWTYLATTIGSGETYGLFTLDSSEIGGLDVLGF